MTLAAKELHLTQSGVSQQIKALEDSLGLTLFDRVNRKIVPTRDADVLFQGCAQRLEEVDQTLAFLTRQQREMTGHIRIGYPPAFGNWVVLPLFAQFAREHQQVTFDFREGFMSEMIQSLLDGKLDFAFIDSFATDSHITSEVVATESLWLYSHKELIADLDAAPDRIRFLKELPFIEYAEGEPILRAWFHHNFNHVPHHFNVRARMTNPQAVARLVLDGVGAAVLPEALVAQLGPEQHEIKRIPETTAVKNQISLAHLTGRTHTSLVIKCQNWIKGELRKRL